MYPFEQGGLDALCGIYSLVNAERIINGTSAEESQQLFSAIIAFLDKEKGLLASILTEGMLSKHIRAILKEVLMELIPYQKLHFAGTKNPDLSTFWSEVSSFLSDNEKSAVLLGISGVHDHWTVVKEISEQRIRLLDSDNLCHLNRCNCTTSDAKGKRLHILYPAQTYFLKSD